jgi:hypothetical protein
MRAHGAPLRRTWSREHAHELGRRAEPLGEVHAIGARRGIAAHGELSISGDLRVSPFVLLWRALF